MLAARLIGLPLLDDVIRPLKHTDWNYQTNLFCRLKVNDEFKFRHLLHRQVTRFCTLEDFVESARVLNLDREYPVRPRNFAVGHRWKLSRVRLQCHIDCVS
jgi:hypothetical protein